MCGGTLEIEDGQKVVTCDFCGIAQTVYSFDNEKKINLFKRANLLRFKSEFDSAAPLYESIITEFPNDAEAYWGLILCKYGIEYVDDSKTGKKIPICHRPQLSSIFDDDNYKSAIDHADIVAKSIYEKEAKEIDKLQKDILAISSKEEPFDVFICYKETDDKKERTKDSVLAQKIYNELIEKKYRVFFSKITLEDKLGTQYEPYIFAALNSSRVMIHVTSSEENTNSVWVRNEWSRFLKMISSGQKKTLIPCYIDISPYELPDEMQRLQGQDMSKLGAMQDLIRGVEKIVGKKKKGSESEDKKIDAQSLYIDRLEKGKIYLSKGLWDDALSEFNSATKLSDTNGQAFLGLLLASYKCSTISAFCVKYAKPQLLDNQYFIKAKQHQDEVSSKQIELIERKIEDSINLKIRLQAIHLIKTGKWKEADELIKPRNSKDLNERINEEKYDYLIENVDKVLTYNEYYFDEFNGFVGLAKSIKDFKDVNEYLNKLNARKESLIETNKELCEKYVFIELPTEVNTTSLFETASKCAISQKFIMTIPFVTESLRKNCIDSLGDAIKWVIDNGGVFFKTHKTSRYSSVLSKIVSLLGVNGERLEEAIKK